MRGTCITSMMLTAMSFANRTARLKVTVMAQAIAKSPKKLKTFTQVLMDGAYGVKKLAVRATGVIAEPTLGMSATS